MTKKYTILVSGKVQGVGFRFTSYLAFQDLGLKGKAENLKDGSLLIEATGEEAELERLAEWAKRGPEGARVQNVQVTREDYVPTAEEQKPTHS